MNSRAKFSRTLFNATEAVNPTNPILNSDPANEGDSLPAALSPQGSSRIFIPVYHVELVRDRTIKSEGRRAVHNPDDVVAILRDELLSSDREKLIVLMLNSKNVVIGMEVVSIGTLTQSSAHPREIFKAAIIRNSAAIILSHGHPSGDPTPSLDDIRLTERISKAGELLGIKLLDHVIIAELGVYSFAQSGRLP